MTKIIIADINNLSKSDYDDIYKILTPERKRKVDGFVFESDKKLSALSEVCLYYLISTEFRYNERLVEKEWKDNFKPCLKNIPNLKYSISHSGNKCIVGISDQYEIGLDIEYVSQYNNSAMLKDIKNIISEKDFFLTSCEINDLHRVLTVWTKREALFKSIGNGSLSSFLKQELSKEELENVKSFFINDYIVSVASVSENIKITDAKDIGIRNIINRIKKWRNKLV